MNILIIADGVLLRELHQNGIIVELWRRLRAQILTVSNPKDLTTQEDFDIVIRWTLPEDSADFSGLKLADTKNFISLEFPVKITYWEKLVETSDAWGKPMSSYKRECPEYHTPSKYRKQLMKQLREVIKRIEEKRKA